LGAARASRDAAVAQYEGAVQGAFADVANALARRGTIDEQLSAQSGYVVNAERAATISQSRYRNGIDTWLTALDAARTAYAARQGLVSVRLARE
ncbi:TolC family protein, partial [Enterococcus faecalis]|uniref:TolC family protein n=1 Tax=Enterococcus faecalis TaxID=1351 RepID=UPI00403F3F3B